MAWREFLCGQADMLYPYRNGYHNVSGALDENMLLLPLLCSKVIRCTRKWWLHLVWLSQSNHTLPSSKDVIQK